MSELGGAWAAHPTRCQSGRPPSAAQTSEPGYAVLSSRSRAGCVRHSLDPATSLQTANANGRLGERVAELQPRTFTGIVSQ